MFGFPSQNPRFWPIKTQALGDSFLFAIKIAEASLVWAKLILGRFRDAVLPDFSRFPAGSNDYLDVFFTDPCHERYCGRIFAGT